MSHRKRPFMESHYRPVNGKSKIEKLIEDNSEFRKSVRFEPSTTKEGYVVLTDGTFRFGYILQEEFQGVLDRKVEPHELSSRPTVLEFVDCDTIEANTNRLKHQKTESGLSKYTKTVEVQLSKIVPERKGTLVAVLFFIVAIVAAPMVYMRLSTTDTKRYGDEFYARGMAQTKLDNLAGNWARYHETEKTKNPKLAEHTAEEIAIFSAEVDREKLTADQRETLMQLLDRAKVFLER
jgi:hypothetical protein